MNKTGYKDTIPGWIPEDWDLKRLRDVAYINPSKKKHNSETFVSFLAMADVSEDGQILNEQETVYGKVKNGFTAFERNDILVAKITPCFENGKGAFLKYLKHEVGFGSTEFHVIRAGESIIPEILFYHTRIKTFRSVGELNMVGSAGQRRVPVSFLEGYLIPLPPLREQHNIAAILSTWDAAIAKEQKLIESLQTRLRALMQQLLTGKKRLKGFTKEWKQLSLGEILSRMANGVAYNPENTQGLPVTRIETISTGAINFDRIGFADRFLNQEDYRLQYGDILYSHINSLTHVGKVAIYLDKKPLYHGMNLLLLRINHKANNDFIYYWLNSRPAKKIALSLAKPAINQVSISTAELKSVRLNLPSLQEQAAVAAILNTSDQEIQIHRRRLSALQQQKKGLMQVLLTGKVRVKTTEL